LTSGNQRYAIGDHVKIELQGTKYPYLTMFNLPLDGHVEFFIPDPASATTAASCSGTAIKLQVKWPTK
jgi:hypothetical protein